MYFKVSFSFPSGSCGDLHIYSTLKFCFFVTYQYSWYINGNFDNAVKARRRRRLVWIFFYPWKITKKKHCSQLIYAQLSMLQKWGKKLVRGVKNFWIVKYDISAFFCTKNHVKILKTCENRFTWNLEKIEMFFGWKQKFEKISFFWSRKFFSHFFPIFK